MQKVVILVVSVVLSLHVAALAQENRSEMSLQGTGVFTKSTSGNGTSYSTTESAGALGTYRYHLNHWISFEGAYGYSPDTQKYSLSSGAFRIQSGIHQFTRRHGAESPYPQSFADQSLCAPRRRSLAVRPDK